MVSRLLFWCVRHPSLKKKKGIKLSVNTTVGSLYNLLKYKNLTTLLYRITQVNTPLKQNLQAEFSTAELGHWNQAGVSLQTKDDERLTPLLSASTLRDIWKRTITEPAQLSTVTHLLSIRNEEFHLSPCHAVFCIYFRSLSSKPWFDLTSLTSQYFTGSQINKAALHNVARHNTKIKGWAC